MRRQSFRVVADVHRRSLLHHVPPLAGERNLAAQIEATQRPVAAACGWCCALALASSVFALVGMTHLLARLMP